MQSQPHVLREYAFLADGERGILVGPRGDYVWMCFPRWDSDAIFSELIGGGGAFAITPRARFVWGGYYEQGSLIWRSRWTTDNGAIIECREALALPSRQHRAVILRRVLACRGAAHVDVFLDPRGAFGQTPARQLRCDDAGNWRGSIGETQFCLVGAANARPQTDGDRGGALTLDLHLEQGTHHDLVLVLATDEEITAPEPDAAWSETEDGWRDRVPQLEVAVACRDARHSYAVLAGLTSAGGGMVAAATMSLPERAREGRSYDYRYVWIRDQSYAGQAVAKAGPSPLLDDAVRFVGERLREHGPDMKPAYTTTGGRVPDQRTLDLPGYPGGSDIVGNWVNEQFQLDAFGESLLLFAAAGRHDRLDADAWQAVEIAVGAIEARWREADAGIWELGPNEWAHSRLICAAGLRAVSSCERARRRRARWLALAETLIADTSTRSVHASGRWQRAPNDPRVDAALLLPAIRGAVSGDDPRSRATLAAYSHELTDDGFAYRYRPDERPLGEAEGAFLLCGFILSLAYARQGDKVSAARFFERNRTACGPPGLFTEEFDVAQRQLRGNVPQAFVHALMLECALEQSP